MRVSLVPQQSRSVPPTAARRARKPWLGQKIVDACLQSQEKAVASKRAVSDRAVSAANMIPVANGQGTSSAAATDTVFTAGSVTTAASTMTSSGEPGQVVTVTVLTTSTMTSPTYPFSQTASPSASSSSMSTVSSIIRSVTSSTSSGSSTSTSIPTSSAAATSSNLLSSTSTTASSLGSSSSTMASATSAVAPDSFTSTSKSLAHNTTLLVTLIAGSVIVASVVLFGLAWLCRRSRKRSSLDKRIGDEDAEILTVTGPWQPRRTSIVSEAESKEEMTTSLSYYESYLAGAMPQFSMDPTTQRISYSGNTLAPPHRLRSPTLG